jgi:hypothetical protein
LTLPPSQPISLVDFGHQNADARDQVNVAALVVILQIEFTCQVSVLDFEEVAAAAAAREEQRMGETEHRDGLFGLPLPVPAYLRVPRGHD